MTIHKTAIIDKNADIDTNVMIGPNVVIEGNVKIAKGTKIWANAYIAEYTEIGENTQVHMSAVLGHTPQDLSFKGEKSYLKIGKNNIIRECATVHRGSGEGTTTLIGDNNFLMANSHVAHNCIIGNNVIVVNGALLAGHVQVGDMAFISGNVVIHQFCRIGSLAMIGGFTGVNKDVAPYMCVRGPSIVYGINTVGLRRAGIKPEARKEIKNAYDIIYRSGMNTEKALNKIIGTDPCEEVLSMVKFIKESKRGISKNRYKEQGDNSFYGE